MIAWLMASCGLHALIYAAAGPRSKPFLFASLVALVFSPLAAIVLFGDVSYESTLPLLIVFTAALLVPVLLAAGKGQYVRPTEASIADSDFLVRFLWAALVAVLVGNYFMYQNILGDEVATNLYELNVVMSSETQGSAGIAGRIARLAMPIGVLAFACSLFADARNRRRHLLILAVLFAATLVGVRRAVVFYQVAFYAFVWLATVRSARRFLSFSVLSLVGFGAALSFFGYVQVQTKKASGSAFASGLNDGLLYFAGNLPYAECITARHQELPFGISFSFIFNGFDQLRNGRPPLGKPFCALPDGTFFNTSPLYFDLWSDFGFTGVIFGALVLGVLASSAMSGAMRVLGFEALILAIIAFGARESLVGMLDIAQFAVVYPLLIMWLTRQVRRRQQGPTKEVAHATSRGHRG